LRSVGLLLVDRVYRLYRVLEVRSA
jgi:hypothetical protein